MGGRVRRVAPALAALAALAVLAGCGSADQSSGEAAGTYQVDVVGTSFPREQHLAQQGRFVVVVRNTGKRDIPDLAVTLQGLTTRATQPDLADRTRPVWVVDEGPSNGTTAYVDTWALGRVTPGTTRRFVWRVTATTPGEHHLRWRVGAGLTGSAQAVTAGGDAPEGEVVVRVSPQQADARVDPDTGEVVRSY